ESDHPTGEARLPERVRDPEKGAHGLCGEAEGRLPGFVELATGLVEPFSAEHQPEFVRMLEGKEHVAHGGSYGVFDRASVGLVCFAPDACRELPIGLDGDRGQQPGDIPEVM